MSSAKKAGVSKLDNPAWPKANRKGIFNSIDLSAKPVYFMAVLVGFDYEFLTGKQKRENKCRDFPKRKLKFSRLQ